MKKSLLFLLGLLITGSILAQDAKIKWYTFEEAVELNKEEPKKVFIDVYTDWCGWCKKMDQSTFKHPVIVAYMNEYFYPVKLDAERTDTVMFMGYTFVNPNPEGRRSSHQLAQALLRGKMSYPSYAFMNEKNEVITVVPGYQQAKEFEKILHYFAEDAFMNEEWVKYSEKFKGEIE